MSWKMSVLGASQEEMLSTVLAAIEHNGITRIMLNWRTNKITVGTCKNITMGVGALEDEKEERWYSFGILLGVSILYTGDFYPCPGAINRILFVDKKKAKAKAAEFNKMPESERLEAWNNLIKEIKYDKRNYVRKMKTCKTEGKEK